MKGFFHHLIQNASASQLILLIYSSILKLFDPVAEAYYDDYSKKKKNKKKKKDYGISISSISIGFNLKYK